MEHHHSHDSSGGHSQEDHVRKTAPGETGVPLAVVGVDFRIASSAWRNHLLLEADERASMTEALRRSCAVEGIVVLETCNRVEWIVAAAHPRWAADVLRAQMQDRWLAAGLHATGRLPMPYTRVGQAAVQHILRTAVGLESFVVGEREIAGQLNRSVVEARKLGITSSLLNALQTAVGRTVRKVQRLTHWRHHARGVHGLALEAAERIYGPPSERKRPAVVVGMGEIGRKAAMLLAASGWKVQRVNRTVTPERAKEWQRLADLPRLLHPCDLLVVATGAQTPVVDLRHGPVPGCLIDLGAPPQIDVPAGVKVWGLDELLQLPSARPRAEDEAAVHELVQEGVAEFLVECRKRELAGLLRAVHDAYDRASHEQLPAVLAHEMLNSEPEQIRRVETAVRDVLRDQARTVVQHIEAAAHVRQTTE